MIDLGSILGPTLFNIFLSDLMEILKQTSPVNYADDNTLGAYGPTNNMVVSKLTHDGSASITWFRQNFMKANAGKFQFLITDKDDIILQIDDTAIEKESQVKLLGILLDDKLKFSEHVNEII